MSMDLKTAFFPQYNRYQRSMLVRKMDCYDKCKKNMKDCNYEKCIEDVEALITADKQTIGRGMASLNRDDMNCIMQCNQNEGNQ
jgi:hypothetical protein